MTNFSNSQPVFIARCEDYNEDHLYLILKESFDTLGIDNTVFAGKNVLLKPNLVMAKNPDAAATTHPAFARAAARLALDCGAASVTLADSPGGPFSEAYVSVVYSTCGMKLAAKDGLFDLNSDFGFSEVHTNGVKLKTMNVINAFLKADVIVDLCRLKTHSLTGMSCAVKNLFGVIPGVEKFQMHSNFPEVGNFSEMLVDLAQYVTSAKSFIAVCDAVVSMEGNGPSHGVPKKTGMVLVSHSPFALDVIGERIMFGAKSDDTAVIRDLDGGRIALKRDKLAYRKTEHELNAFTFINRLPLGRTFSTKRLTAEKEYLYFESGKKAPCVYNNEESDLSDVERIYYLVCVGGREQPVCAYNAQLFEPSKRDGDSVPIG